MAIDKSVKISEAIYQKVRTASDKTGPSIKWLIEAAILDYLARMRKTVKP